MTAAIQPADAAQLGELLRSRPGRIRLLGTGSQRAGVGNGAAAATTVSLARLDRIDRLDAGDQTCSVQPGVRRADLDAALAERGLELPCLGGGTLGGLFAGDPIGAAALHGLAPRSLLLGMEAMLACGTAFRSGARVVKSVAGFDVHKLLVGSCGRLFAATLLHLRLKPRPRAEAWFDHGGLDASAAWALFANLQRALVPPVVLQLYRGPAGCSVRGRLAGHASSVLAMQREHALRDGPAVVDPQLRTAAGDGEIVAGTVVTSGIPKLLAALPPAATFAVLGSGRFEAAVADRSAADRLLAALPGCGAHGAVAGGTATAIDAGAAALAARIKATLDPDDIFG